MAKMKNKLQELIDWHIEDDCMNPYAIKKWNKQIREHKRNLRRWETEARATTFKESKNKMRLNGLIDSDDEEGWDEPTDFISKNIGNTENY